jgi:dynein heavy chain 1
MALVKKVPAKIDWAEVKTALRQDDFIKNLLNFDKNDIPPAVKKFVNENYLKDVKFDAAKIQKASAAAGPLALWVKSIVEYSEIFHSIEPLRAELAQLEDEEARMKDEYAALERKIADLEAGIEDLKAEYAVLIAKVETLKADMKTVQEKVDRSVQLISNLSSERVRWEASSKNFVN